jgi:trimethylamine corrinoid protein
MNGSPRQSSDTGQGIRSGIAEFEEALLSVNRSKARRLIQNSCTVNAPGSCLEMLIIPALEEIGKKWEQGEVALSQVYMSGKICEEIVDAMLPPGHPDRKDQPLIAIVVLEDHHALGKRILYSMLRAAGYEVKDYGTGVTSDILVQMALSDKIQILLISTLMLPAAIRCQGVIDRIKENQPGTKIIVGGAPFRFDPELWREVHADAMGHSAIDTIEIIRTMTKELMK